jgi:hypothetical protein
MLLTLWTVSGYRTHLGEDEERREGDLGKAQVSTVRSAVFMRRQKPQLCF